MNLTKTTAIERIYEAFIWFRYAEPKKWQKCQNMAAFALGAAFAITTMVVVKQILKLLFNS